MAQRQAFVRRFVRDSVRDLSLHLCSFCLQHSLTNGLDAVNRTGSLDYPSGLSPGTGTGDWGLIVIEGQFKRWRRLSITEQSKRCIGGQDFRPRSARHERIPLRAGYLKC